MFERSIDDVAEALQACKQNNRRCSVLIGAGCSKTAGIPLARELVDEIKRSYPAAYKRAMAPDYPGCMAALDIGIRRDLIGRYIDSAKINWAHIALAQLIQADFVDRVLTTNFDPLISRACALINVFPAVYDFAASHVFKPDQVGQKAIFHLHGQRDGFVLLNTQTEVNRHKRHVRPIFEEAGKGRMWIVVGYSGENDPIFDLLAGVSSHEYGLYWIGNRSSAPQHVRKQLLVPGKGAHFVGGWDADDFFVSLTQKLHCFPPTFVRQPFTYLTNILGSLSEYKAPHEDGRFDVCVTVRAQLEELMETHEQSLSAEYHFLSGEYDVVKMILGKRDHKRLSERERYLLSSALNIEGNSLHDRAKEKDDERLYREAIAKFREATRAQRTPEALYNWGNALFDLSILKRYGVPEVMTRAGEELLWAALKKYKAALSIEPDFADAHNNCGNALCDLARSERSERAVEIYHEAMSHYESASKNTAAPDMVHCNWGKGLHSLLRLTNEQEIFEKAQLCFSVAADCNPDHYSTFLSWANLLSDAARQAISAGRKTSSARLFKEAFEKYERAAAIETDDTAAYWNWQNDLRFLMEHTDGTQKASLAKQAASIERRAKRRLGRRLTSKQSEAAN